MNTFKKIVITDQRPTGRDFYNPPFLNRRFYIDEFFFIGIQPCESNSSEAIRDIDPNVFGGPSLRLALLTRSSFEGHG